LQRASPGATALLKLKYCARVKKSVDKWLAMPFNGFSLGLPAVYDLAILLLLVVVGLAIIILLVKILLFILPAAVIAFVVWLLTGSLFLAGVAFLIVAFISILKR
jgi:hypothetical protein